MSSSCQPPRNPIRRSDPTRSRAARDRARAAVVADVCMALLRASYYGKENWTLSPPPALGPGPATIGSTRSMDRTIDLATFDGLSGELECASLCVRFCEQGDRRSDHLITARLPIEEAGKAYELLLSA